MRVLVCGGRAFPNWSLFRDRMDALHNETPIELVIQGGAHGADEYARGWASNHRIPVQTFAADWQKHGKAAGPIRNGEMLRDGKPDVVVAFPGGKGTADMVRRARQAGVRVIEVGP